MVKQTGLAARNRRLARLSSEAAHRRRMAALFAIGQHIETDAEISITAGSISGKDHVPSAPGEPPNADTRLLDTSIETTMEGPSEVHVTSNAPYSAALEFGTSKIEERPFMRPATEKNRGKAAIALRRIQDSLARG